MICLVFRALIESNFFPCNSYAAASFQTQKMSIRIYIELEAAFLAGKVPSRSIISMTIDKIPCTIFTLSDCFKMSIVVSMFFGKRNLLCESADFSCTLSTTLLKDVRYISVSMH